MLRQTITRAVTKVLDEKQHRVEAVVSTETRDRQGDIVKASGWQLDNFRKHSPLLTSHDYTRITAQIGEWHDMTVRDDKLVGVAEYFVGRGNPEADWAWELATRGVAAFSVGFIPDMTKAKELPEGNGWMPNYEFNGQELLEVSQVTVPANPDALQRMKGLRLDPVLAEIVESELAAHAKRASLAAPEFDAVFRKLGL